MRFGVMVLGLVVAVLVTGPAAAAAPETLPPVKHGSLLVKSHVAGRLKPGTTTAGFLRMVLSAAEVADFKQRTASLRDVYLARSPGAGPAGREAS